MKMIDPVDNIPFRFCPGCGAKGINCSETIHYSCSQCGWDYFHNTAAAAGVILYRHQEILLIQRNHEPGKGLFDVPGGFVNIHESAEQAMLRECYEEIGFQPKSSVFFKSFPNQYWYNNILYYTCDLYFVAEVTNPVFKLNQEEVSQAVFIKNHEIDPDTLAFESTRKLIEAFLKANING